MESNQKQSKENKFNHSKIYKIISNDPQNQYFYIGSTTQQLSTIFYFHKWRSQDCKSKAHEYFKSVKCNVKIVLL